MDLADEVIAFDDEIDHRYHALQQGIEALLALQTPVAVDLRLVLAMLHVNLHLERMGDHCVTIAKLSKLVVEADPDPALVAVLIEMGERAEEIGLARNRIILSAKVSAVQDLIAVYTDLAARSDL